jgi:hypothetical protein
VPLKIVKVLCVGNWKAMQLSFFFSRDRCRKLQAADCADYFHAHLAPGRLS